MLYYFLLVSEKVTFILLAALYIFLVTYQKDYHSAEHR
jgi:hypothetical protein